MIRSREYISRFLRRGLTDREVFWFYFFAAGVFVYPIIKVDYMFYDDNSRSLLMYEDFWRAGGRILVQLFYNAISFSTSSANLFPLAHLIMLPVIALSLRALATCFFAPCTLGDCFVMLPLIYAPTTLGILIYQYDGPAVMLGVAAVIYAVVYRSDKSAYDVLWPAVLVAMALSIYQVLVNVLIGLYCFELAVQLVRGLSLEGVLRLIARRAFHLLAGLLIYYLTAMRFLNTWRSSWVPLDQMWPGTMWTRLGSAFENLGLFLNSGNSWLFIGLSGFAFFGYLWGAVAILRRDEAVIKKSTLLVLYFSLIPIITITVAGLPLLFKVFEPAARVLLGIAPVLVVVFFFSHKALRAIDARATCLLVIPLFCMLSFAYMYGRILMSQKTLESSILYSLAYDIHSRPELRNIEVMYLIDAETTPVRRPSSLSVGLEIPALNYVGGGWHREGEGYLIMPDQFPYVGISNVRWMSPHEYGAVTEKYKVVDSVIYDIYLSGRNGYIQMKKLDNSGRDPSR